MEFNERIVQHYIIRNTVTATELLRTNSYNLLMDEWTDMLETLRQECVLEVVTETGEVIDLTDKLAHIDAFLLDEEASYKTGITKLADDRYRLRAVDYNTPILLMAERAQVSREDATPKRLVVTAANRVGDVIVLGVRHFCPLMVQHIEALGMVEAFRTSEQGFVDQYGVFMDREEALAVATAAGQVNRDRPKTAPDHLLFSEDLY